MTASKEHVVVDADELLRASIRGDLAELEPRFDAFTSAVLERLDGDTLAEPERVLRADEATADELADARMMDEMGGEELGAALRAEIEGELASVDWSAFGRGVADALDAEQLAPQIARLLREDLGEEVAAREGDWQDFTTGVMAKIAPESTTVAELLAAQTHDELERRDGEWNAFTARVFEAVDAEARAERRGALEDQAIAALKADVEAEVESMSPAFGEAFKKGVESEIFKSARRPDPWWERGLAWVRGLFEVEGAYGLTAAAATAILLVTVTGLPLGETTDSTPAVRALPGEVAVEAVSFDGDVTVMPEDGITIVWLDAPS